MLAKEIDTPATLAPVNNPAHSVESEPYRALLGRLGWPGDDDTQPLRTLGLTSCYGGEGVSTVAAQLAHTAAASGHHRILLVDANFTRPSLAHLFGVSAGPGLAEAVAAEATQSPNVQTTSTPDLSILTTGVAAGDLSRVYQSRQMAALVDTFKHRFDLVIFDLPSCDEQISGTGSMAGLLDGLLLVVESERVRWEVAQNTQQILGRYGANLSGVVLNKNQQHVPDWLYNTL